MPEYSHEYPDLTKRQWAILKYIIEHTVKIGVPPSYRELADAFRITLNGVAGNLNVLREKKYLVIAQGMKKSSARALLVNWDKIHGPVVTTRGGRVRVSQMPRDLTPEKATKVAQQLLRAAEEASQVHLSAREEDWPGIAPPPDVLGPGRLDIAGTPPAPAP